MSALDLASFDLGSRRDLFGSFSGRNSSQRGFGESQRGFGESQRGFGESQRGFGDTNMGSSSRRDLGNTF
jgi:hypothetical protein